MSEAPSWDRHNSPPPPLEAGPAGTGGRSAFWPLKSRSREVACWPKSSILRLFILLFYDGWLEALLDEVAHAGAAPVAASVKREIVRQHLQLQVFEAVPA